MIDWNSLIIGDTYVEDDITYEVTNFVNNQGQLIISAQPIQLSE